jgi:hypothetical protein
MKKKVTNINELSQTHGKVEEYQARTLDQIWGDTGMSKYKTLEEDKYMNYLSDMNKSDLQTHASKLGLIPVDDRETLTKRLIKEFRKHVSNYRVPKKEINTTSNQKALRILSEGR